MHSLSKAMCATRTPRPTPSKRLFIASTISTRFSNAGIMIRKPLRRLTLPEWHRVLDTNLTAAFLLARAAEKPLRKARGAIVTVASTRALMSEPNTESYSASKGGLLALTHALAISLAPDVRVNCVSPGCCATSLAAQRLSLSNRRESPHCAQMTTSGIAQPGIKSQC
jgi:NAD(P)-dependent dehydrogenase (short-subunit alcohol dehydrogenase family)